MTDNQWLLAIAKHRSDNRVDLSGDELKGGAPQLAQVLEERVKEQPDRFARLSLTFPADANSVYLERTLCALATSQVEEGSQAPGLSQGICGITWKMRRSDCRRSRQHRDTSP